MLCPGNKDHILHFRINTDLIAFLIVLRITVRSHDDTCRITVHELHFGISRETARRDLRNLEADGVLKRTHGGAVAIHGGNEANEYPVAIREIHRFREKNEICRKAAAHISDGEVIFADNSSTTRYLAQHIPGDIGVTVLTNSLGMLIEAGRRGCEKHTYICLGGIFKSRNLSMYGSITENCIRDYYPDTVFLSCTGINTSNGILTDGSMDEVEAKKMMIQNSKKVILLADNSKLEKEGQVFLCDIRDVDLIIFDHAVSDEVVSRLDEFGCKTECV